MFEVFRITLLLSYIVLLTYTNVGSPVHSIGCTDFYTPPPHAHAPSSRVTVLPRCFACESRSSAVTSGINVLKSDTS